MTSELAILFGVMLVLLGARRIPDFARGLRLGINEFRKASREATDAMDLGAGDAGRSIAGIHGKPAAEALTTENQTVEIYDSNAWRDRQPADLPLKNTESFWARFLRAAVRRVRKLTGMKLSAESCKK
jgi:Sec-independent protein translocase protein TatA